MIKVNLARVKREKEPIARGIDLKALKGLRVGDLLRAGSEYYAGLLLWFVVIGAVAYYFKLDRDREGLRKELESLKAEKTKLQAQAKRFLEEKKAIEDRIAKLKKEIQDIEKSKDIIVGLKSYYGVFNEGFSFYTSYVPKVSWVNTYKQSLDINTQKLSVEMEVGSLDFQSLSGYSKSLSTASSKVSVSQLERKVNPHGIELYIVKLSAERELREAK